MIGIYTRRHLQALEKIDARWIVGFQHDTKENVMAMHKEMPGERDLVLLTGAGGYVGGRLLKELEENGLRVHCVERQPEFLRARVGEHTEVVVGPVLDPAILAGAMAGVDGAYYLVHSMQSGGDFSTKDSDAARNFREAALGLKGTFPPVYGYFDLPWTQSPMLRNEVMLPL